MPISPTLAPEAPPLSDPKALLTYAEAAERLCCSTSTIGRLAREGKLEKFQHIRGRVTSASVEALLTRATPPKERTREEWLKRFPVNPTGGRRKPTARKKRRR